MAQMRKFISEFTRLSSDQATRRNLRPLLWLLLVLFFLVVIYSLIFHALMANEGQEFTWLSGVYWTLTTMSTLGYGDKDFNGDLVAHSRSSCSSQARCSCSFCFRSP
jgi:hypothetical protein